jgi:hypothetical protein
MLMQQSKDMIQPASRQGLRLLDDAVMQLRHVSAQKTCPVLRTADDLVLTWR